MKPTIRQKKYNLNSYFLMKPNNNLYYKKSCWLWV